MHEELIPHDVGNDDVLLLRIKQVIEHSFVDNVLTSYVNVNLPVVGNMDHMIRLSRSIYAEVEASNERSFAPTYFYNELKYLLEHATDYEEPIYHAVENQPPAPIGKSVIFIDRARLITPIIENIASIRCLNCAKRVK